MHPAPARSPAASTSPFYVYRPLSCLRDGPWRNQGRAQRRAAAARPDGVAGAPEGLRGAAQDYRVDHGAAAQAESGRTSGLCREAPGQGSPFRGHAVKARAEQRGLLRHQHHQVQAAAIRGAYEQRAAQLGAAGASPSEAAAGRAAASVYLAGGGRHGVGVVLRYGGMGHVLHGGWRGCTAYHGAADPLGAAAAAAAEAREQVPGRDGDVPSNTALRPDEEAMAPRCKVQGRAVPDVVSSAHSPPPEIDGRRPRQTPPPHGQHTAHPPKL